MSGEVAVREIKETEEIKDNHSSRQETVCDSLSPRRKESQQQQDKTARGRDTEESQWPRSLPQTANKWTKRQPQRRMEWRKMVSIRIIMKSSVLCTIYFLFFHRNGLPAKL